MKQMNQEIIEKIAAGLRNAKGMKPVCIVTTEDADIDMVCGIPIYHNDLEGMSNNGVDCEYFPIYTEEQLAKYPMLSHWFRRGFENYTQIKEE